MYPEKETLPLSSFRALTSSDTSPGRGELYHCYTSSGLSIVPCVQYEDDNNNDQVMNAAGFADGHHYRLHSCLSLGVS